MPKMKQLVLLAALLALTTISAPGAAGAAGFNQFVGLGDSTIDTGYFRYHSTGNPSVDQALAAAIAQGATGGWAGNGVMVSTILAGRLGLNASPIGGGGTNYANGAAYTVDSIPKTLPGNVRTVTQVQNYLSSVNGVANPKALYVVSTGNNDIIYLTSIGGAAANPNFLNQLSSALAAEVAVLQAAGARTILVPNSFFSAVLAGPGGVIPSNNADEYASAAAYGALKWSKLAANGVRFIPADNDSVFRYVAQHPTLFGFTASTVLASNAPSSVVAFEAVLTPAQQQDYLFIDGKHLTTAGQTIEADYIYSLLTAPSQISLLTESAVQGGLARAATIQGQIDLSAQHRGPTGINVWASSGPARENEERTGLPR